MRPRSRCAKRARFSASASRRLKQGSFRKKRPHPTNRRSSFRKMGIRHAPGVIFPHPPAPPEASFRHRASSIMLNSRHSEARRRLPGAIHTMKVSVIIPAAGLGTRMGRSAPEKEGISRKQFMLLNGSPILVHTIRKFVSCALVTEIVVALRGDDLPWADALFKSQGFAKAVRVVEGGETRQQSVENALATLNDDTDLVAVHDAVRPFIEVEVIEKVVREANESGAAIVGIVPVDT